MILQLNPAIAVNTPCGPGKAIFFLDYGKDNQKFWLIHFNDNSIKCFHSDDIKLSKEELLPVIHS